MKIMWSEAEYMVCSKQNGINGLAWLKTSRYLEIERDERKIEKGRKIYTKILAQN
jgi:hypothetical protein